VKIYNVFGPSSIKSFNKSALVSLKTLYEVNLLHFKKSCEKTENFIIQNCDDKTRRTGMRLRGRDWWCCVLKISTKDKGDFLP
jgi:hypothetical protein